MTYIITDHDDGSFEWAERKNLTTDPEVLGAFSADDPLETRVGKEGKTLGMLSRESEITDNFKW